MACPNCGVELTAADIDSNGTGRLDDPADREIALMEVPSARTGMRFIDAAPVHVFYDVAGRVVCPQCEYKDFDGRWLVRQCERCRATQAQVDAPERL